MTNSLSLTISRIDTRTRQVTGIPVGDSPTAIAAAGGSIWVSVSGAGDLARIDPGSGTVSGRLALGASPYAIAVSGDRLWVATRPFASRAHFGGTLRVAQDYPGPFEQDPARAYFRTTNAVTQVVYDGLVALHKTDGAAGYDLVPDLAVDLPRPMDGGRTYTFSVRPGIRYSDGRMVRPADFRRGLTREFTATTKPALRPDPWVRW